MSILVYRDRSIAGAAAATLLAAQIIEKPDAVLGLDYQDTLAPVYRALARMSVDGLLDWSEIRTFALSELVQENAEQTIRARMNSALFERINARAVNIQFPETDTDDWSLACNDYEEAILDVGGMDLLFLGVNSDGSIAFLPGSQELAPVTHVELTDDGGRAVTVGITTIMSARKIVVLMTGDDKADIASRIFHGPVSPLLPASYLQLHANVVFLLDEAAAKLV